MEMNKLLQHKLDIKKLILDVESTPQKTLKLTLINKANQHAT